MELRTVRAGRGVRRQAARQVAAQLRSGGSARSRCTPILLRRYPELFVPPRQTAELDTAWLSFVFLIRPDAGFDRADMQQFLEERGIDTRTVWTGNAVRQPMMRGVEFRQPEAGLPNADAVMERGMLVPMNHGLGDDDLQYVCDAIEAFVTSARESAVSARVHLAGEDARAERGVVAAGFLEAHGHQREILRRDARPQRELDCGSS